MPRGFGFLSILAFSILLAGAPAHAAQILLIDDAVEGGSRGAKTPGGRGDTRDASSSVLELQSDLQSLGHTVSVETASSSDPEDWPLADFVIWSSGNHPLPLGDPAWRASLRHFILDGGRLLIEGGDAAFHWIAGDPLFAQVVLHSSAWLDDPESPLAIHNSQHPLMNFPNEIPFILDFSADSYTDADAVTSASGALMLLRWGGIPMAAGLVGYDPDPEPNGGQIVYLPLRYSALDSVNRQALLENMSVWLLIEESGDAGFAGNVHLVGESDHAGVKVRVQPGGQWTLTEPDGGFLIDGLYGGVRYNLEASRDGFADFSMFYELEAGEILDGLFISLDPVLQETQCREPILEIPDDDPIGIFDTIDVSMGAFVQKVEVFLDIRHSWIGDLIISLESPEGTVRLLHLRGGSNLNEIYGWYPLELDPVEDLSAFADELTDGAWKIQVADLAGADLGTLYSWCLRLSTHDGTAAPESPIAAGLKLFPNWPNPFNPKTMLSFELSGESRVILEILDSSGRTQRHLFANPLPAGAHHMEWDGRDDKGRLLPSGLYVLRLESESLIQSRKLLLLK